MTNVGEVWKTIPLFPKYQVSNFGRVKNVEKNTLLSGTPHKQARASGDEYVMSIRVFLGTAKNGTTQPIHKLVMDAFGTPKTKHLMSIDHIDRDVTNNHINNLRWATKKQQAANRKGRFGDSVVRKFAIEDIGGMYDAAEIGGLMAAAEKYGVTRSVVCMLLRWVHPKY